MIRGIGGRKRGQVRLAEPVLAFLDGPPRGNA